MNSRNYLPTKNINELPHLDYYRIYNAKRLQTKFGPAILLHLYNYQSSEKFKVFLPARFAKMIPDDDSDSDDDNEDFPKSIGFLTYFDICFRGKEKLNNGCERYDVRFQRADNPYMVLANGRLLV
jgi:hypothetical protein